MHTQLQFIRNKAFTLIELLIVLGIISVIAVGVIAVIVAIFAAIAPTDKGNAERINHRIEEMQKADQRGQNS